MLENEIIDRCKDFIRQETIRDAKKAKLSKRIVKSLEKGSSPQAIWEGGKLARIYREEAAEQALPIVTDTDLEMTARDANMGDHLN